jgi:hypothetical protein
VGLQQTQSIPGRKKANPSSSKNPVYFLHELPAIRNMLVNMSANDHVETLSLKREFHGVGGQKIGIRGSRSHCIGKRLPVNVRACDRLEMPGQEIGDDAGRTPHIQNPKLIHRSGEEIRNDRQDLSSFGFTLRSAINGLWPSPGVIHRVILVVSDDHVSVPIEGIQRSHWDTGAAGLRQKGSLKELTGVFPGILTVVLGPAHG